MPYAFMHISLEFNMKQLNKEKRYKIILILLLLYKCEQMLGEQEEISSKKRAKTNTQKIEHVQQVLATISQKRWCE